MSPSHDWTPSHDLAVIYFALAYGTGHELEEDEVSALTDALEKWTVVPDGTEVREVVMEAATVFLEGNAQQEVRRSIRKLGDALSFEERQTALRDVLRIAEADGVLLAQEQELIHFLSEAWSLKEMGEELIQDTTAVIQREEDDWGIEHELAFLYILVAHSTTEDLSSQKIDAALQRLQEWRPDLSEDRIRNVFRRALQVYADDPDQALIRTSVEALKTALPLAQRLAVLNDLYVVARADGDLTDGEGELIQSLAQAWDVRVRLNGQR